MAERFEVTTEKLLEFKESWEQLINSAKEEVRHIGEAIASLEGTFACEAVELFQKKYREQVTEIMTLFKEVLEHVQKLEQIAQVYSETERSNIVESGTN